MTDADRRTERRRLLREVQAAGLADEFAVALSRRMDPAEVWSAFDSAIEVDSFLPGVSGPELVLSLLTLDDAIVILAARDVLPIEVATEPKKVYG